jgi:hypothetical protein
MVLPPLPHHPAGGQWSDNVEQAYEIISAAYDLASQVLTQEAESNRLRFHAETLTEESIPLLSEMEAHAQEESIPIPWLHSCARLMAKLIYELLTASDALSAQ